MRIALLLFYLTTLASSFATHAYSQVPNNNLSEFAEHVPKDVAVLIHIPEFQDLLESSPVQAFLASKSITENLEYITDWNPKFQSEIDDTVSFMQSVREAHILIWNSTESTTLNRDSEFVVAFASSKKADSQVMVNFLHGCQLGSTAKSEDDDQSNNSLTAAKAGRWLIIGNSTERVNSLKDSLVQKLERSLRRDRRYQMVLKQAERRKESHVVVFARPEHVSADIFGTYHKPPESSQKDNHTNNDGLSSVGVFCELGQSGIWLELLAFQTLPVSGKPERWNSMAKLPAKLPTSCFETLSIDAKSWDMNEVMKLSTSGNDSYKANLEKQAKRFSISVTDLIERSSMYCSLRYVSSIGQRRAILLEKVDNYEAMKNYLDALTSKRNGKRTKFEKSQIQPSSVPDAIVFETPLIERKQRLKSILDSIEKDTRHRALWEREFEKVLAKTGKGLRELGMEIVDNRGFVLTEDWLITGDVRDACQLVDSWHDVDVSVDSNGAFRRLQKLSEKCAVPPFRSHFEANVSSSMTLMLTSYIESKYGRKSSSVIDSLFSGRELENLKNKGKVIVDPYDLFGYILCEAANECYSGYGFAESKEVGDLYSWSMGIFLR